MKQIPKIMSVLLLTSVFSSCELYNEKHQEPKNQFTFENYPFGTLLNVEGTIRLKSYPDIAFERFVFIPDHKPNDPFVVWIKTESQEPQIIMSQELNLPATYHKDGIRAMISGTYTLPSKSNMYPPDFPLHITKIRRI